MFLIPYQSISPDSLSSLKLSRDHIQKASMSRPSMPKFQDWISTSFLRAKFKKKNLKIKKYKNKNIRLLRIYIYIYIHLFKGISIHVMVSRNNSSQLCPALFTEYVDKGLLISSQFLFPCFKNSLWILHSYLSLKFQAFMTGCAYICYQTLHQIFCIKILMTSFPLIS